MLSQLGVRDRVQAVIAAYDAGLDMPTSPVAAQPSGPPPTPSSLPSGSRKVTLRTPLP